MKTCTGCGEEKEVSAFVKDKWQKDGLRTRCKACTKKADAAWAAQNRDRKREADRRYQLKNRDRLREKRRAYFREWHKRRRVIDKDKGKTRDRTKYLIRKGVLVRQPCEVCGVTPVHAHHTDYTKPEQVRWLCHDHHMMEHRKYR